METLYVVENGIQLKKKSNRIAVKKDGKIIKEYRVADLKRVMVFGNSQITTELMRFLSGKGIEVAFLSSRGKYHYRLVPEMSKNIYLRMAQHERYQDMDARLRLSRSMVSGKIKNQRIFLIRYRRNQTRVDLSKPIEALEQSVKQAQKVESIEGLRGVEGNASRIFFASFGKLLLNGFEFSTRAYHPPPDPVNAMLGFGYMLVFNELSSLLEAFGFDVYLGFFHETRYGRKSLASDIIEELRSPIADRLVLYLINKGVIKNNEFTKTNRGVNMSEESKRKFLANYEGFMTALFVDKSDGKRLNFRQVLKDRVKNLEAAVMNGEDYTPYVLRS